MRRTLAAGAIVAAALVVVGGWFVAGALDELDEVSPWT